MMTRFTKPARGLLVAALVLLAGVPAGAKELSHRLREGESVEAIARHFYGSRWKAVYILARNKLGSSKEAKVGQRLYIPTSWTYTVRRGDYPTKLAKKYLGSTDRHGVLMQMNGLKKTAELKVGQELLMPFHATYVVQKGDSLSAIAKRFYRTTRKANVVKDYNGGKSELHPGNKVTVPIFDRATLDVKKKGAPPAPKVDEPEPEPEEEPEPEAEEEPEAEPEPEPAAETEPPPPPKSRKAEIAEAVTAYDDGEFGVAAKRLEELLDSAADQPLPPAELATTVRYLAFCAVAFADPDMAREYFRKWLEIEPKAKLDPVEHSPKIIEVFDAVAKEARD